MAFAHGAVEYYVDIFRAMDHGVPSFGVCCPCIKKKIFMIQFNTTFFIPVDKVGDASAWMMENYMPELRKKCGANVMLGRLLTALEDDHVGLTAIARFESVPEAEEWDATYGVSLRQQMGISLKMPQVLHFSSMIEIIEA